LGKVNRPAVIEVLSRKRLFDRLDLMRKRPVIWVTGPPGCGKTTLVASYLDARKLPCLWYQVDAGDADPATFFYYLGQAAKKAVPRTRKPFPLLTPEYLQGIPAFTQRFFENLYSRLEIPSILVFDNYHEVPSGSQFHEVILNGLSNLSEGISAILISRSDPPPIFVRLRANELMEVLGWNELRLTLKEGAGIVRLKTKARYSQEAISRLYNSIDGWVAGLILMLKSAKEGEVEPRRFGKLPPEEVFEYFASEILAKTDKDIQDFLLKTAFLPKMTARMAENLTGLPSASRVLSDLSRTHYFTEKRLQLEPMYQYHPLFREFLLARVKETYPPEELSFLIDRAASLLEESGQAEAAAALLQENENWEKLGRFIIKHAPVLASQGRNQTLGEWLGSLPKEILEADSWLLYWMGATQQSPDPSGSRVLLEKAFEEFKNQRDRTGMFLSWSDLMSSIWFFEMKDFSILGQWTHVLDEMMRDFKEFPSEEVGARVASNVVSIIAIYQPWHPEIEAWVEKALSLAEACSDIHVKRNALFQVGHYRVLTGQFRNALALIDRLRQLSRTGDPIVISDTRYLEAIYYRFLGMHEKCLQSVSEGLALSRETGYQERKHWFCVMGAASAVSAHDFMKAEELLAELESSASGLANWTKFGYHLARTRYALSRGDPKQASLHADLALKFVADVGDLLNLPLAYLAKAHVMHELGKQKEAADHLADASRIADRSRNILQKFLIKMGKARFAFDRGDEASGLLFLREALAIGKEEGIAETYVDSPSAMSLLCARALEAGIEVEYVQEIIRKRNLTLDELFYHLENWPWPVKILTLGRFELMKDKKPIRFSRKVQQKPLSMLKVLIALGGREVKEEIMADILWPEADGDAAHRSFISALHRLRQLISCEKALHFKEGRLTLDKRYCWLDVWALENIWRQADTHRKEGRIEASLQLTEKAIGMYRGHFLGGETEQPWLVSIRERLRGKFLSCVNKLGRHWEEIGQWEKALECYQRGLDADDLAEEFYQNLMTCYLRLDREAEARAVYHRCRKILSSALGIEPSAKTQAIYKSLLEKTRPKAEMKTKPPPPN
jgi:LuxR family maltose regulon positive regulatory protein